MSPRKPTRAVQLGVTDDDYARMLEEQGGHCALCPSTPKTRRFSVDHDHATGRVRGLLCHRCNRALPTWMRPEWLRAAADYLEHGTAATPHHAFEGDGRACDVCGLPFAEPVHCGLPLDNSTAVVLSPPPTAPDLTTG